MGQTIFRAIYLMYIYLCIYIYMSIGTPKESPLAICNHMMFHSASFPHVFVWSQGVGMTLPRAARSLFMLRVHACPLPPDAG